MIEEVSKFYRNVAAPSVGGAISMIYPLQRIDFLSGTGVAVIFLIKKVAESAIYLVASIFTCFNNKNYVDPLLYSIKKIPTYAGAIPLGIVGALFPKMINEKVLGIPAGGLVIQRII